GLANPMATILRALILKRWEPGMCMGRSTKRLEMDGVSKRCGMKTTELGLARDVLIEHSDWRMPELIDSDWEGNCLANYYYFRPQFWEMISESLEFTMVSTPFDEPNPFEECWPSIGD